jgi:predicted nucleic acid-binding protein
MIVLDTNIIAFLVIEGEWSAPARRLVTAEPEWSIPSYWRYEMASVLSNYVRFKGMSLPASRDIWRASLNLVGARETPVAPEMALELSVRYRITAYDALYVALAMELGTLCITGDRRLRKAVPSNVRMLDEIIGN